MTRRSLVLSLLALWAAVFLGAFVAFAALAPTGDGFARGLNRVGAFLGWQAAAGAVGVVLAIASRRLAPGPLRRWSLVPLGAFVVLALALAGLIAWANLSRPEPASAAPPAAAMMPGLESKPPAP
jgi:hypothetical protein